MRFAAHFPGRTDDRPGLEEFVRLLRILPLAAVLLLLASASHASTILLSNLSSDTTPASQLDATLQFMVTGSQLSLTLTNTTGDDAADNDAAFLINEIYWNGSADVTGLTLLSATKNGTTDVTAGWGGAGAVSGGSAAGFGTFDFALTDGVGFNDPNVARPGESIVFLFDIAASGPVDMSDFVALSTIPPGNSPSFAAAKFVSCRGADCVEVDDSAYGATDNPDFVLPEPATTALLLGALGLGLLVSRRR